VSAAFRLPAGGRIDRSRTLAFTFDGRRYEGHPGDTLASALLANGVSIVGRSVKYHRPRGIVAAGVEEPNAIVQVGDGAAAIPNARATEVELYDGLVAKSLGGWPGRETDALAVLGCLSRFLPAGFYYKTFMSPSALWPRYERVLRRLAGLGSAPDGPDPDRYEKVNAHCDVLVAGGGPAGLVAARAAGETGARVILVELDAELGGSLLARDVRIDGALPAEWLDRTVAALRALPAVRILTRSTVFGYQDQNFLTIAERCADHLGRRAADRRAARERVWRVRAGRVVLATGAHERPLVFGNNDLPGILLASALVAYVRRFAVLPGRRVVVATNNDLAYDAAFAARDAGATVTVVDARSADTLHASPTTRRSVAAGIVVMPGMAVVEAHGRREVEAVSVAACERNVARGPRTRIACDVLATSGGHSPAVHLHAQGGGATRWHEALAAFVPERAVQRAQSVGGANGTLRLSTALAEALEAGRAAAAHSGAPLPASFPPPRSDDAAPLPLVPLWRIDAGSPASGGAKAFVDLQNDVTVADIHLAAREGYRSIEHVKRYTALGFGTDQGKLGNVNGMAILAETLGQSIPATGTTTFRPNYTPVTFGTLCGRELGEFLDPVRKTALHAWHEANGAVFEDVGQWKRPYFYPRAGESMDDAVRRECRAVRNGVGIFDASTLGKIDIRGPDAVTLLDRVYTNAWRSLGVGRCRYGLMLGEDGMVFDDGVTARLGDDHYLMSTTTGAAARVLAWIERWLQTEWPDLSVYLTSVTDQWSTIAVAGPWSRDVVSSATAGVDFANSAFPFMSAREGEVAGVPARIARISFSGELAFEVNVPADFARHVWEALHAAGARYDIAPYGTEAMHVLRAEKGYIIVGQDTDGSVTPLDLGMGAMVSAAKDCIGKRSLARSDTARADRRQLVGLITDDPSVVLPEGGQLLAHEDPGTVAPPAPRARVARAGSGGPAPAARRALGHVTSAYWSGACDRSIALALLATGRARHGERLQVFRHDGPPIAVTVCAPVFYDPEGKRLHG
jgi:sarcosine oxidase subunit alpha